MSSRTDPGANRFVCRFRTLCVEVMCLGLTVFLLGAYFQDGTTGGGGAGSETAVMAVNTYVVSKSTHVYAQGLAHESWGDAQGTPVDLRLDLYVPDDAPGPHPAAIFIHGGGFVGGSRHHGALSDMAEVLSSRGWVCASVDYRLAGVRGTVPPAWLDYVEDQSLSAKALNQGLAIYAASRDVKAALRWLTAHAEQFSIDTTKITVLGGSAGAVLAVMLGATEPEDYRDELAIEDDPTLTTTNLESPSAVHSIVDFWGSGIAVELLEDVYGLSRFDSNDAPLLIIHGTRDQTVTYDKAIELHEIWTRTGVPVESHALIGAGHAAWNETVGGRPLVEIAFDFIVRQQDLSVVD